MLSLFFHASIRDIMANVFIQGAVHTYVGGSWRQFPARMIRNTIHQVLLTGQFFRQAQKRIEILAVVFQRVAPFKITHALIWKELQVLLDLDYHGIVSTQIRGPILNKIRFTLLALALKVGNGMKLDAAWSMDGRVHSSGIRKWVGTQRCLRRSIGRRRRRIWNRANFYGPLPLPRKGIAIQRRRRTIL
jgi:hypothetical protein